MNKTLSLLSDRRIANVALIIIAILLIGYALHYAREIFLPLALALLFKLLLDPVVARMVRWRLPRPLAALMALTLILILIGGGLYTLYEPAVKWVQQVPESLSLLEERTRAIREPVETANNAAEQVEKIVEELSVSEADTAVVIAPSQSISEQILEGAMTFLGTTATIIILLYFMLASGDSLLRSIIAIVPGHKDRRRLIILSRAIEKDLSKYLLTVVLINSGLGFIVGIAMWFLDMPNPALWGVLAGVMNFIPYLGSLITFVIIGLVSISNFESSNAALAPPLIYIALTVIEGHIITMFIHGRRMTVNPVMIFLSLLVWGWIWGAAGALLAVPILASIKICIDHISVNNAPPVKDHFKSS